MAASDACMVAALSRIPRRPAASFEHCYPIARRQSNRGPVSSERRRAPALGALPDVRRSDAELQPGGAIGTYGRLSFSLIVWLSLTPITLVTFRVLVSDCR